MIRIFIPSWRRAGPLSTVELLKQSGVTNYQIIVRENEYKAYAKHHDIKNLTVIGKKAGLNVAREYARQRLRKNEWCLQMDDNVQGFVQCEKKFYKANEEIVLAAGEQMITRAKWQKVLSVPATFKEFYDLAVMDTMTEAIRRHAALAGFSAHENPAFRGPKFSDVGYVCGKTMLMKNQGLSWNQSKESACEDYALTAAHLYHDGRVLINKWAHPLRIHYQAGGCGPYEERLPAMLKAQRELLDRFGSLFGIKNANNPEKKQGELRIRFHSLEQVRLWREEFTWFKGPLL